MSNTNFLKMTFVSNVKIDNDTLHSLYTSVRFKDQKVDNLTEQFKIWNEGRNIYLIIAKDKIENDASTFEFTSKTNQTIKIKKFSEKDVSFNVFENDEFIRVSGFLSYARKEKNDAGDLIEVCPVDFKGNIKNKNSFAHYLTEKTGLDFEKSIDDSSRVMISRLFIDDIGISNDSKKSKVFIKNLIAINALVRVKDAEKVNALNVSSIGKKRSYGLGNLFLEEI